MCTDDPCASKPKPKLRAQEDAASAGKGAAGSVRVAGAQDTGALRGCPFFVSACVAAIGSVLQELRAFPPLLSVIALLFSAGAAYRAGRVPCLLAAGALWSVALLLCQVVAGGHGALDTWLLTGAFVLMSVSALVPLPLLAVNSSLIYAIYTYYHHASLLTTLTGVVGVNIMACLWYLLLDYSSKHMQHIQHPAGATTPPQHSVDEDREATAQQLHHATVQAVKGGYMRQFQSATLAVLFDKGFGTDVPAKVQQRAAKRWRRRCTPKSLVQVNLTVAGSIKPAMLPPDALRGLVSLLKSTDSSLLIRAAAVREGCIIVTLDILQLAGSVISNSADATQQLRQLPQQQEVIAPSAAEPHPDSESSTSRYRVLREEVAASGQQWLHSTGLDNQLENGTEMCVQVLDCMHHFFWDAAARRWVPGGTERVPFGGLHSLKAHSLIALMADPQPPAAAPKHSQNADLSSMASVDVWLDIGMCPGDNVTGWGGEQQQQQQQQEQLQQHPADARSLQLLARLEGQHVPVTILEEREVAPSSAESHRQAACKQVVCARVACKERPCMMQLELWQHHMLLAPACGVLVLPSSMAEVGSELNSWVDPRKQSQLQQRYSGDMQQTRSSEEEEQDRNDSIAAFVGDLGVWLEFESGSKEGGIGATSGSCGHVDISASSSTYDSMQLTEGTAADLPLSPPAHAQQQTEHAPEAAGKADRGPTEELASVGCGLLQQAVAWAMPAVAELVLRGLMQEPLKKPFHQLANGSIPDPPADQDFGLESSEQGSQVDEQGEERMESLLNLALLSCSSRTLARVLSWAHTYGGPGFAWAWRAVGAYGITPLLRMQAMSNTHRDMLELVMLDLYAGPGLLTAWLQEGPRGLVASRSSPSQPTSTSTRSSQSPHTGSGHSTPPMNQHTLPYAPQTSGSTSAGSRSSRPSAELQTGSHRAHTHTHSEQPLARSGSTVAPATKQIPSPASARSLSHFLASMLAYVVFHLPYWRWLLQSLVFGFPSGPPPSKVLAILGFPSTTIQLIQGMSSQQPAVTSGPSSSTTATATTTTTTRQPHSSSGGGGTRTETEGESQGGGAGGQSSEADTSVSSTTALAAGAMRAAMSATSSVTSLVGAKAVDVASAVAMSAVGPGAADAIQRTAHAVPALFGHTGQQPQPQHQQQQQEVQREQQASREALPAERPPTTSASESLILARFSLQEPHYREWVVAQVAPMTSKLSVLAFVIPFMSYCASPTLGITREQKLKDCLYALPFYGGMSMLGFMTMVLSSGVGRTMKPRMLEAWFSFYLFMRMLVWLGCWIGILPNIAALCGIGLFLYMDFIFEIGFSMLEQIPFFHLLTGRVLMALTSLAFYRKHDIAAPCLRACILHGMCLLMGMGQGIWHRHTYVLNFLPPKKLG